MNATTLIKLDSIIRNLNFFSKSSFLNKVRKEGKESFVLTVKKRISYHFQFAGISKEVQMDYYFDKNGNLFLDFKNKSNNHSLASLKIIFEIEKN